MLLYVENDYGALSKKAANLFADRIREKPAGVYGFATGSTPLGMYRELIKIHNADFLDFSKAVTFNLDEYFPIKRADNQSYYHFMNENLFNHINVTRGNVHIPDGEASDAESECRMYEIKIQQAGGIDCQILGVGANGHIGFNEPGESFGADTRVINLTEMSIQSNSRFFNSPADVPRQAITMGVRTIMMSRSILLICSGKAKAAIFRDALCGPITPLVPASVLQLHPDVCIVADKEAASLLP
ncbi:MAG: glucosamine-6-phosphate deaminase [Defluviitaleaceae bacterium]|nr:glucosamine-6-phosphate deaminase [Defluviitaleaceae bacterium]